MKARYFVSFDVTVVGASLDDCEKELATLLGFVEDDEFVKLKSVKLCEIIEDPTDKEVAKIEESIEKSVEDFFGKGN